MVSFPYGEKLVLVTRTVTGRDSYGNDVYGLTTTVVVGAFAPGGSSELIQGQDTLIANPTVYLPAGTAVGGVDAVVRNPTLNGDQPVLDGDGKPLGDWYEVDGPPAVWSSPLTGWSPGVEVRLERVTG